jgi:pimeloyl-ACP methyl ester carboxylesterase
MGGIIAAVETRLKTAIVMGGFYASGRPESNMQNYAPRVTMPILSLVGRYDSMTPYETSTKPLFDFIGTPDDHKLIKVYETDHIPPKSEYIVEILAWLDRYLGPVGGARVLPTPAAAEAN